VTVIFGNQRPWRLVSGVEFQVNFYQGLVFCISIGYTTSKNGR
jgi:hypothetical protein